MKFIAWKHKKKTKIDRNTNIPEDLGAVIYDITNILKLREWRRITKRRHIKKNRKIRDHFYGVF